jgi:hypothetical protein
VRHALRGGNAGEQFGDRDAAADVQVALRGAGDRVLDHRPPGGRGDEPLVTRLWRPVLDERGQHGHQVEPCRIRVPQRLRHVGQHGAQHVAPARLQEMRLPELRDTAAVPVLPGVPRRAGHRLVVPLQDGDLAAVPGQHHPGCHSDEAATDYDDLRHQIPPICRNAQ